MLLSDKDLLSLAQSTDFISPFIKENCEGATINLTLNNYIKVYDSTEPIILGAEVPAERYKDINISTEEFILQPNQSVLVQTNEYFKIPSNMAANILERYSVKLLGIMFSPASYINPGYEGRMSFLAVNNSSVPIRLVPGIKFCQLAMYKLTSESLKPYSKQSSTVYLQSEDVSTSKLHLDKEIQGFLQDQGINNVSKETAKELGGYLMTHISKAAKEIADMLRKEYKE
ncbi:TPA: dCTP deaminase [Bacillus cereus]|nr:dCTP deaminase [Bacillus cereus]